MKAVNRFFVICICFSIMLVCFTLDAYGAKDELLKRVRVSFLREEYQEVVKECNRLLLGKRLDTYAKAELYYLKGVSYLKQRNFSKAKDNLLMLISRYGKTGFADSAYLSLADCYFLSGDFDNAIIKYKTFISRYPDSEFLHLAYYRLGECYYRQGQWTGARNYLNRVINKYQESIEADLARKIFKQGFHFTIQVGAFLNKDNANQTKNRLVRKNYPVYITTFDKKGKTFYRVRVGKFDTKKEVLLIKNRLKKDGFTGEIYP